MKFLIIDSSKRKYKDEKTTDFIYEINKPDVIKKYIKLIYAHIPNTKYLIKQGSYNDKLIITFQGGLSYTINLLTGNYV